MGAGNGRPPTRLTPGRDGSGAERLRQKVSSARKRILGRGRLETTAAATPAIGAAMARMETRCLPALLLLGPSYKKPKGSKQPRLTQFSWVLGSRDEVEIATL